MVSMIPFGKSRPVASEYPQIAENVRHALEDIYYGIKQPKQALDDAAKESAKILGW
jgi:multiple sugar transport system substrate-binding protein